MSMTRFDATVLEGEAPATKGWYAWNDLMPPPPDSVHVIGEVLVPNPGVVPHLSYRVPQGINPAGLLLELHLHQLPGMWPQWMVWKPVRYDAVVESSPYTDTMVFHGAEVVVSVTVHTVSRRAASTNAAYVEAATQRDDEVPLPRRKLLTRDIETPFPLGRDDGSFAKRSESPFPWSTENPFPWSSPLPMCFSGSLSRSGVDFCMDGAKFVLAGPHGTLRVTGANQVVEQQLDELAHKRVIVTACGRIKRSVEKGCTYLLASAVSPAADFLERVSG